MAKSIFTGRVRIDTDARASVIESMSSVSMASDIGKLELSKLFGKFLPPARTAGRECALTCRLPDGTPKLNKSGKPVRKKFHSVEQAYNYMANPSSGFGGHVGLPSYTTLVNYRRITEGIPAQFLTGESLSRCALSTLKALLPAFKSDRAAATKWLANHISEQGRCLGSAAMAYVSAVTGSVLPADGKSAAGKSEAGKSEAGKPEAGKPEAGKPEAGKAESYSDLVDKLEACVSELLARPVESAKLEQRLIVQASRLSNHCPSAINTDLVPPKKVQKVKASK